MNTYFYILISKFVFFWCSQFIWSYV